MFTMENVPLSAYSTMRLGGNARYLTEINDSSKIAEAIIWAKSKNIPIIMIGNGSNIIWTDAGWNGLVLVNRINKFEVYEEDADNAYVTIGAGENWDSAVKRIVDLGYSGVAELSLIPGTTGATPVQNVGAYGQEIAKVLTSVEAYDTNAGKLVTLDSTACEFGYRTSRFKTTDKGRFFITAVTLHVNKEAPKPPYYSSVESYFKENNITNITVQKLRDAVIAIRNSKMPDPAKVSNNGSFFTNPIVSKDKLDDLLAGFPGITYWEHDDKIKLSAAWLIEQAGFKDFHDDATGMATWPKQPLVIVNEHAQKTADLISFKKKIVTAVHNKFGIELVQEPEIIGS